jgi:ComF family protein
MLARLGRFLLDAVAPRRCAGCDAVSDQPICVPCLDRVETMPVPGSRRLLYGCAYAGFAFEEPVRTVLHRAKYGGDRGALEAIAALTARRLGAIGSGLASARPPDWVLAVPLGRRRRRQRGFNQSEVIARVLGDAWGVPTVGNLDRVRDTPPQSARDEVARRTNVAGAFLWAGPRMQGEVLMLVDDVLTTGATVDSAAAALHDAGASRIDVVVAAVVP